MKSAVCAYVPFWLMSMARAMAYENYEAFTLFFSLLEELPCKVGYTCFADFDYYVPNNSCSICML